MFESVGQIAQAGPVSADQCTRRSEIVSRRTGAKVRGRSHRKGYCESIFWRPMSKADARSIVAAARRYDLVNRRAGDRNGPLGHVALEILDFLANLINKSTGRLDPTLDYLMVKLRRSRDAIVRALKALRRHGFLDWLRRYVPTGEASGPQVRQTSNAYRLHLPAAAKALLGRYFQPAPIPDDEQQRLDEIQAMLERAISALSLAELPSFLCPSDDPAVQGLNEILAKIAPVTPKFPQFV